MTLGMQSELMIGSEAQMVLQPNASFAVATYHVGRGTNEGQYALKSLAPTGSDYVLTSAGKYLHLIIDITNVGGAGTLTVTILGFDPVSGKFYTILASTALAAVATTILKVGPALTAAANLVANDFMPVSWGCQVVVGGNAVVFSLGALFMP
jgi:hypothetical protein